MNKKKVAILILFLFFLLFLFAGYKYYIFSKKYATTDAMFIRSDKITNVSFKRIKGKVSKLYFKEGDFVKQGILLAEIDPVDYLTNLKEVVKKIESLKEKRKALNIQIDKVNEELKIKKENAQKNVQMLQEKLMSITYRISMVNNSLVQTNRDYKRYKNLYEKKAVAKRVYEKVETQAKNLKDKKNSLIFEKKALAQQIYIAKNNIKLIQQEFKNVEQLKKEMSSISKQIEMLMAKKTDLIHSVNYCKLYAPFDGFIGKKYVEIGMNIKSGNPVYSMVDKKNLYVEILLEETKLNGIKPGCKAYFTVDSYGNKEFEGIVSKIYPASAATYALVPRDISAGEFTKVAQRILIRVDITKGDKSLLIPGMGGKIKIVRSKLK
jgi:membrane fusion protein (multidrug efflux system)